MAITLTVAGTDRTAYMAANSLSIVDTLNNRNTAGFTLAITDNSWKPSVGDSVVIEQGTTKVFAGTIETTDGDLYSENSAVQAVRWAVKCADNNQIADRRLVAAVYDTANQTLSDIVTDIVTNALSGESVTTTNVATGPVITSAIYNYDTVTTAFNDLSNLTGYSWWIDYDKDLHFVSRDANAAPFALTDTSANYRKIKLSSQRATYRNVQYIRAGTDTLDAKTETFIGDGHAQAFVLTYDVAKVPSSVKVNGVDQTIGIKGVDSGKDWYWQQGSNTITQDASGTVLTSSDELSVTYQGQIPILVQAEDDVAITERSGAEGGSGRYEAIASEPNINSQDAALEDANGFVRRYGVIPETVTFETDTGGLSSGQLLPVANTLLGIGGTFLIDKVAAKDVDGKFLRYTVEALSGEHLGGWREFFRGLVEQGQVATIRNNEVIVYLRAYVETITLSDSVSYTTAAPESRVGTAIVGYSEVA